MNVLWRSLARMSAKLIITTVAGKIDIDPANLMMIEPRSFSGDGRLAINAQLNQPADVDVRG